MSTSGRRRTGLPPAAVAGIRTTNLGEVVESITNDLKRGGEDSSCGAGAVVNPQVPPTAPGALREFVVTAAGGIAAGLGIHALGAG